MQLYDVLPVQLIRCSVINDSIFKHAGEGVLLIVAILVIVKSSFLFSLALEIFYFFFLVPLRKFTNTVIVQVDSKYLKLRFGI